MFLFRQVISYNKYTGPYATHKNKELVFFDQNRTRCEAQMAGYQREHFRGMNGFCSVGLFNFREFGFLMSAQKHDLAGQLPLDMIYEVVSL